MNIITTTEKLTSFCQSFNTAPFVTVDTEFMREGRYWAHLCLIQLAGPEDEAIIDPLAQGLDLGPFFDLMQNQAVVKVFHAARQDLEIFIKLSGQLPDPLFDTQIAAMALGLGDCVSYDLLVQARLQRHISKASRYTNWAQRPLSEEQLHYALSDVTGLRDLYPAMRQELEERERMPWIAGEMAHLKDPALYAFNPDEAWKKIRIRRTKPVYLAVLKVAAAWREEEAQRQDKPRGRFLKDEVLNFIAENPPKTVEKLENMRGVPKGFGRSRPAQRLLDKIQEVLTNPEAHAPKVQKNNKTKSGSHNKAVVELLRVLLQLKAAEHELAPKLIAVQDDLEELVRLKSEEAALLQGWRGEVFGRDALKLIMGEAAMTLQGKKVKLMDIQDLA